MQRKSIEPEMIRPDFQLGYHAIRLADADIAADTWGFNCGPGALCGITGLSPAELRPFLGDFEQRGYMNPTLMRETLRRLGVIFQWRVIPIHKVHDAGSVDECRSMAAATAPAFGLCRVQWGGPWCKPNVPMAARYSQTHWIAVARHPRRGLGVFDVNNNTDDDEIGWTPFEEWATVVAPELIATYPRADGAWWFTHSATITP